MTPSTHQPSDREQETTVELTIEIPEPLHKIVQELLTRNQWESQNSIFCTALKHYLLECDREELIRYLGDRIR